MELPGRRTAVTQAFSPLRGNRVPTVYGANERPADGRIGVGVSAAHDGVDHGFLQIFRMEELPEGVVKRRQNPTLLIDVVGGRGGSGTSDGTKGRYYAHSCLRPRLRSAHRGTAHRRQHERPRQSP